MASDDLVRIVYRPKRMAAAPGGAPASATTDKGSKAVMRRNRTSISMDPDLYDTFVLIEGDARTARHTLRKWATEADSTRADRAEAVGVSRLVHKQMLAKIRDVVRAGLTVIQKDGSLPAEGTPAAAAGQVDDVGAAWDNFAAPAGSDVAKKAIKKAKASSKKAPAKKERGETAVKGESATELGDEAAPARPPGTGLDGLDELPEAAGLVHSAGEWTRERDPGSEGPDPFMGA